MKFSYPKFWLYMVRLASFLSLLLSLIFLSAETSAVIYFVVVAIGCCEFYISSKVLDGNQNGDKRWLVELSSRLVAVLPLFYLVAKGLLVWWVLLICVAFEAMIILFNSSLASGSKKNKLQTAIYVCYNVAIYISIIAFLLNDNLVGAYSLFAASVMAAAFIIISSIGYGSNETLSDRESVPNSAESQSVEKSVASVEQREIVE